MLPDSFSVKMILAFKRIMGLQPSSASEDIPVSTVISGHHHLTLLNYVTVDFVMAVAVLAMLRTSH